METTDISTLSGEQIDMAETAKTTRVRKPAAEVVGSFADLMQVDLPDDGRQLWAVTMDRKDLSLQSVYGEPSNECYILAATERLATRAVLDMHDVQIEKISRSRLSDRMRDRLRAMTEPRNGEKK